MTALTSLVALLFLRPKMNCEEMYLNKLLIFSIVLRCIHYALSPLLNYDLRRSGA